MKDLLGWLKRTDAHPLIAGSVFHYELEFIHPFADGNGRIGRLWQTLILSRWNPLFAYLPVESVIRDRQAHYYKVLAQCDNAGNSTAFIEFLLAAILPALREAGESQRGEQVSAAVSEQVARILKACSTSPPDQSKPPSRRWPRQRLPQLQTPHPTTPRRWLARNNPPRSTQ